MSEDTNRNVWLVHLVSIFFEFFIFIFYVGSLKLLTALNNWALVCGYKFL